MMSQSQALDQLVDFQSAIPKISRMGGGGSRTRLFACVRCHLLKTKEQFDKNQCENCPDFDSFEENTTSIYEGIVTLINPKESYVGNVLGLSDVIPGMYAMTVGSSAE
ncbi:Spt4/RpoE2 zinc finger [Carpediemonas membranifera]|uniref:Spt4/RpoE2 zinc finger n=1 Tax=Carpediemonas membranifera TaxID=201153 RepID=A0A8J6B2B9_9EUKA|nr:Spt4/RpoE2 zinc finger [Carpediemonas membranifera]|eukprot:KAG9391487.1 Spt4/RpoE2 zinc finger [Carpediemonas membranifera]